jgi:Integrase zinc binding domain
MSRGTCTIPFGNQLFKGERENSLADCLLHLCGILQEKWVNSGQYMFEKVNSLNLFYLDANDTEKKIKRIHEMQGYGHPRVGATMELAARRFGVTGQRKLIESVVKNCLCCQINKMPRQVRTSLMSPFRVPEVCGEELAMDLCGPLKFKVSVFYYLVMVDRLSCYVWTSLYRHMPSSREACKFALGVMRYDGLPIKKFF